MTKIITATGKEFPTKWFGVSSIDGAFRAHLLNETINSVFPVFSNPTETQTISLVHDSMSPAQELVGYTAFHGMSVEQDGVVISLKNG